VVKIFYDTELLEEPGSIDLISIGMVAENGCELYLINEEIERDPLHSRIGRNWWLMENVVTQLPLRDKDAIKQPHAQHAGWFSLDQGDNRIVPLRYIRNAVRDFILATPDPELWAYYAAYDHVMLSWLFGGMADLPFGIPAWTNCLKQLAHELGDVELPPLPESRHNALEDARWNRTAFAYLSGVSRRLGRGDACLQKTG
jgi:hypothetical protein